MPPIGGRGIAKWAWRHNHRSSLVAMRRVIEDRNAGMAPTRHYTVSEEFYLQFRTNIGKEDDQRFRETKLASTSPILPAGNEWDAIGPSSTFADRNVKSKRRR